MKEILATTFFTTLDEPVNANDLVSNKEFYAVLSIIAVMLALFGAAVHLF